MLQNYELNRLTSNRSNYNQGGSGGNIKNGGGNSKNGTPRVIFAHSGDRNVIAPSADGTTIDNKSLRFFKC